MRVFYFIRIKFPFFRLVHDFFKNALSMAITILIVSISIFLGIQSVIIFFLCYGLFGALQGGISALLFTLVSKKFTASEDGTILGYWVGSS